MAYHALLNGETVEIHVTRRTPRLRLTINDAEYRIDESKRADGAFQIDIDGRTHTGWRLVVGDEVFLRLDGRTYHVGLVEHRAGSGSGGGGGNEIRSEMPGTVVDVKCEAGQAVTAGQTLLTIESMKLQMAINAHFDGTVEAVHVKPNATFERGALLVSLKPLAADGDKK